MARPPRISRVRLVPATGDSKLNGMIGWLSFVIDGTLLVDGVALRRAADGRHVFTWPAKHDQYGRTHHVLRPVDDDAREQIEDQLLLHVRPWLAGGAA